MPNTTNIERFKEEKLGLINQLSINPCSIFKSGAAGMLINELLFH